MHFYWEFYLQFVEIYLPCRFVFKGETSEARSKNKKNPYVSQYNSKELGHRLGYGENSADVRIAQYESGQRTPKQETLIRIAEISEVDVRNFFKSWNCNNGRINGNFILDG